MRLDSLLPLLFCELTGDAAGAEDTAGLAAVAASAFLRPRFALGEAAGCISDCKEEYDSAVESCKSRYDSPDEVEDLQQCIQEAKDEYQSCVDECTT